MTKDAPTQQTLIADWRAFHAGNKHDLIDEPGGLTTGDLLAGFLLEELGSTKAALRYILLFRHGGGMAPLLTAHDEQLPRAAIREALPLLFTLYMSEQAEPLPSIEMMEAAWSASSKDFADPSLSAEALAGSALEESADENYSSSRAANAAHEIRRRLYDYGYQCAFTGLHPNAREALWLLELTRLKEKADGE
ncbi:MAG TPA: hypothetical protein VLA04_04205 [Verrucomicrobiae bacterium]|nr:hypothetical protein [Verrucomicrobiae bacterium]